MKWQAFAVAALLSFPATSHAAEKKYGTGISDTEIKLGQTSPFSGAASAYSVIAKAQAAYFRMINDQGGVNGRKINLITLDDAYSPPKTVEQTRRLVEQEEVAAILNPLGTGRQPRHRAADAAARHPAEDLADGLFPDPGDAAAAVSWRNMGAVRGDDRE